MQGGVGACRPAASITASYGSNNMTIQRAEKVLLTPATPLAADATPDGDSIPADFLRAQTTQESRARADAARPARWGPKKNILETVAAAKRFTTLLRALEETHLAHILDEAGPFTVFAPTDAAFARMPEDELRSLLADKARLRSLLSYHIVASKVRAPRERVPNTATAIDGRKLTMVVDQGHYKVNDARIVETNLRASNGLIHAIDAVLAPR